MNSQYDIVIVGGGVIGCAIARSISSKYRGKFALIEKENRVGSHASSRNSGVIHSGFYESPGSLSAKFCVEGNRRLLEYCHSSGVSLRRAGTLVVARDEDDHSILEDLKRRGMKNDVKGVRIINKEELRQLEPHIKGSEALYSPMGSIIDSGALVASLASDASRNEVDFLLGNRVEQIHEQGGVIIVKTNGVELRTSNLINCAGLYADWIAKKMAIPSEYGMLPFRGQYYELHGNKSYLLNSMVLGPGIHMTKTIDGRVIIGPKAVLAPGKEAYRSRDFDLLDMLNMLSFQGFWRMALNHTKLGLDEFHQSVSTGESLKQVQRLLPSIDNGDLVRGGCGIRAQLVDRGGNVVDDLIIKSTDRSIHVLNPASPGMTCSLPVADHIAEMAGEMFGLSSIRARG